MHVPEDISVYQKRSASSKKEAVTKRASNAGKIFAYAGNIPDTLLNNLFPIIFFLYFHTSDLQLCMKSCMLTGMMSGTRHIPYCMLHPLIQVLQSSLLSSFLTSLCERPSYF
jgi:hypothetical protein